MATSEAQEIKKQETLVKFRLISYNTRLRVIVLMSSVCISFHGLDRLRTFSH